MINEEITSQNPPTQVEEKQVPEKQELEENKDFLIMKKLNIETNKVIVDKKQEKKGEEVPELYDYHEIPEETIIPQDF